MLEPELLKWRFKIHTLGQQFNGSNVFSRKSLFCFTKVLVIAADHKADLKQNKVSTLLDLVKKNESMRTVNAYGNIVNEAWQKKYHDYNIPLSYISPTVSSFRLIIYLLYDCIILVMVLTQPHHLYDCYFVI